jgi:hypothetical protein
MYGRCCNESAKEVLQRVKIIISIILATICLAAIGIAGIDFPEKNPEIIIYAFDQNPAGLNEGNEWVTIHNFWR